MVLYIILEALIGVCLSILLPVCTKKVEGVVYNKLDKIGQVTNVVLIPVYIGLSLFCMALSFFCYPRYEGFLGFLGWVVCIIIASAPLICGLGWGLSFALRKKGKSKPSFIAQFAGLAGCALSVLLFFLFYGNLLQSLN